MMLMAVGQGPPLDTPWLSPVLDTGYLWGLQRVSPQRGLGGAVLTVHPGAGSL